MEPGKIDFFSSEDFDNILAEIFKCQELTVLPETSAEIAVNTYSFCKVKSGRVRISAKKSPKGYLDCTPEIGVIVSGCNRYTVLATEKPAELIVVDFDFFTCLDGVQIPLFTETQNVFLDKITDEEFESITSAQSRLRDGRMLRNIRFSGILAQMRENYMQRFRSAFIQPNGFILFGNAPSAASGVYELCITDAVLCVEDRNANELQRIRYSCRDCFEEKTFENLYREEFGSTGSDAPYVKFNIQSGAYFKNWLFPKTVHKLDFLPFEATVKLKFRCRANQPGKIFCGISNVVDYNMTGDELFIPTANIWTDCEVSLVSGNILKKSNIYVMAVSDYIDMHFSQRITVEYLAERVYLHPNYLSRIFKQKMGCTISQYITSRRIKEVKKLLHTTDWTVEAISERVGFYDANHLQKYFKKYADCSPLEFRNNCKR